MHTWIGRGTGRPTLIAILSVALLATAGCGIGPFAKKDKDGEEKDEKRKKASIVIPVEADFPTRGEIASFIRTHSRVEAENKVDIVSEGVGTCTKVNVEEGDSVTRGQILAELDKDEALASLSESKTRLRQSLADYERAKNIHEKGLLSQADYDAAFYAFEQAGESVNMQQVQIKNLTIVAPFDGVITQRTIQLGMLVTSGTAAFSLIDPQSFVLAIHVPERELPRLHVGQAAEISLDAAQDRTFSAAIRRINPSVDRETGQVKVLLDFEEAARPHLREAAFARVKLIMDTHENALLVHKESILEENARQFVFVVRLADEDEDEADDTGKDEEEPKGDSNEVLASPEDHSSEDDGPPLTFDRVEVQIGLEDSIHAEILSGVEEGDLVVTNGQHSLAGVRESTRVRITNATDEIMGKAGLSAEDALAAANKKKKDGTGQVREVSSRKRH